MFRIQLWTVRVDLPGGNIAEFVVHARTSWGANSIAKRMCPTGRITDLWPIA